MFNYDLHIHSEYSSDGEFTVDRLVDKCIAAGIEVFTISDHNVARGNEEAAGLARRHGLGFVPGIEIDCRYGDTDLHVLGLGIEWTSDDFRVLEEDINGKILASFDDMIANLTKLGFTVDAQAVIARAGGKLPSAELIAEVMLEDERYYTPLIEPYLPGGARSDMPYLNFYLDYFAQGKPAFVPIEFMDFRRAVEMIRDNGGTPIVAHPGHNLKDRERVVEELLENGAAGLEVFSNYHTAEQLSYFAGAVIKENKLMTCGSDFHGKIKPLIDIGQFPRDARYGEYLASSVRKLPLMK